VLLEPRVPHEPVGLRLRGEREYIANAGACDRHALRRNAKQQSTAGASRLADRERSWRRVPAQRGRGSVARRTAQAFGPHVLRTTAIGFTRLEILFIHLTSFA